MSLQLFLFGGFRLVEDQQDLPPLATTKARSLFAFLALHATSMHTRHLLAGMFWPDLPDASARRRLSQTLWRIHQAFRERDYPLLVTSDTVGFQSDQRPWIDVVAFETAIAQGDEPHLREGIGLYRGEFMAGFYDEWIFPERERLRDLYLDALDILLSRCEEKGAWDEALRLARQLVREEPLRESAHQKIMQLCLHLGRTQEAIRQYQQLETILAEEMGIQPSAPVQRLYQQLLAEKRKRHISSRPPPATPQEQRTFSPFLENPHHFPMIGRRSEKRALQWHLEAAIEGRGGLVMIDGEAGVGKTRLIQAIVHDAAWRGMQVLQAWGLDRENTPAYWMIRQLIDHGMTPLRATQLAFLLDETWLHPLLEVSPSLQHYWPQYMPRSSAHPEQQPQRIQEAVARLFLALSEIHPYLLVLEDIHWANASTLDTLIYLAPRLSHSRVLLLVSLRREESIEQATRWKQMRRLYQVADATISLKPLSAQETAELLRIGLDLQPPSSRFSQRIYEETEGNPLFILEVLRTLFDEGMLYRDPSGHWRAQWEDRIAKHTGLPLPPGVRQIIARRLKRLPHQHRQLLHAAAILGFRFDLSMLAQLADRNLRMCTSQVNTLMARQWIEEEPANLRFSHHLVHQVILKEMAAQEKRRWHRQALALWERHDPDQVETLAYHATHGGLKEAALRYNLQAGDKARALYANREALYFYDLALSQVEEEATQQRWEILQRRESVLAALGLRQEQAICLQKMHVLAERLNRDRVQAVTLMREGQFHIRTGSPRQGLDLLQQAMTFARNEADARLIGYLFSGMSRAYWHLGKITDSLQAANEAQAWFRQADERHGELNVLNLMGNLYLGLLGDYEQAWRKFEEMATLAEELGDRESTSNARTNAAIALMSLGQYQQSQQYLDGVEDFYAHGYPLWQAIVAFCRAHNYFALGEIEAAHHQATRGLALCRRINNSNFAIENLSLLGHISLFWGQYEKAKAYFQQAVTWSKQGEQPYDIAIQTSNLAMTHLYLDQLDEAFRLSEEALVQIQSLGPELAQSAILHFHHYLVLARLHEIEAALQHLRQANEHVLAEAARIQDQTLRFSFLNNIPRHRTIRRTYTAWTHGSFPQHVRLPRKTAPTGRALRPDEWVVIIWMPFMPEKTSSSTPQNIRRGCLLQLLEEANDQGAAPRIKDLASALCVSSKTIKRDIAKLRAMGYHIHTRGAR